LKDGLRGKTYKYICYEIARLRTIWVKTPEIRDAIEKRYKLVVAEFNRRTDNWFWKAHPIDECLGEAEKPEELKEVWKVFKGKCVVVKIERPKHSTGPLKGKSIVGMFNYHIVLVRGGQQTPLGVTVSTEVKAKVGDVVEVQISKTGKFKLVKVEDWCEKAGGKWITSRGRHICIGIEHDTVDGKRRAVNILHDKDTHTRFVWDKKADKEKVNDIKRNLTFVPKERLKGLHTIRVTDEEMTVGKFYEGRDLPAHMAVYKDKPVQGYYTALLGEITITKTGKPDVFYHEFGHHIEGNLTAAEKDDWAQVWREEKVSNYASVNPNEGFAEAVSGYYWLFRGGGMEKRFPKTKKFLDGMLRGEE